MNKLELQASDDTPEVLFDPENGVFEISGRSLPEDINVFYDPILDWLRSYFQNPLEKTEFIIRLNYFNTGTSKVLMEIFTFLDAQFEQGVQVGVKWHCTEDDEDIIEACEEFNEFVELPIESVIIKRQ